MVSWWTKNESDMQKSVIMDSSMVVVDLFRVGQQRMENALMTTELHVGCVAQGRIPDHFGQKKITKLSNPSIKMTWRQT